MLSDAQIEKLMGPLPGWCSTSSEEHIRFAHAVAAAALRDAAKVRWPHRGTSITELRRLAAAHAKKARGK